MQIPFMVGTVPFVLRIKYVWRQSEFAFFRALASAGALFLFRRNNMKKVRTLSVIMVVALLFISCGYSNEDTDKHSHEYIESVTAPTCTERGYTTYTCSDCGDFYLDNYINSKGHNYINHYCDDCNAAKPPETLDDLIFFYEDQMIATCKIKFSAHP